MNQMCKAKMFITFQETRNSAFCKYKTYTIEK